MILSALSLNKKKDTEKENKYKADIKNEETISSNMNNIDEEKLDIKVQKKNKIFLVKK